jgi:hypothetical protein
MMRRRWNPVRTPCRLPRATPWPSVGVAAVLAAAVAAVGGTGSERPRQAPSSPARIGPVPPTWRPARRRGQGDILGVPEGHALPPDTPIEADGSQRQVWDGPLVERLHPARLGG